MQGPEAASLLLDHRQSWERTLPSLSGFHPHGWHIDSLAPHSCSSGGWPKDSCLGAQAPVGSDSRQVAFFLFSLGKLQWMSVCRIKARIWGQEHPQSAIQKQTSQPSAGWSHLSNRRITFLLSVYFRCGMAGVPGNCLGPDTYAASASLTYNSPFMLETLVAFLYASQTPYLPIANSRSPALPGDEKPEYKMWNLLLTKRGQEATGHRGLKVEARCILSSTAADCLWSRCRLPFPYPLCTILSAQRRRRVPEWETIGINIHWNDSCLWLALLGTRVPQAKWLALQQNTIFVDNQKWTADSLE